MQFVYVSLIIFRLYAVNAHELVSQMKDAHNYTLLFLGEEEESRLEERRPHARGDRV